MEPNQNITVPHEDRPVDPQVRESVNAFLAGTQTITAQPNEPTMEFENTFASAARIYEEIRNLLEYHERHLLRRSAIERILRRHLLLGETTRVAEKLLRELIWAHYLPPTPLPLRIVEAVSKIVGKYQTLMRETNSAAGSRNFYWLVGVASAEVDTIFVPRVRLFGFPKLMRDMLSPRVTVVDHGVSESYLQWQLYIASLKLLVKADQPTLRFALFTEAVPEWLHEEALASSTVAHELATNIEEIDRMLADPLQEALVRSLRRAAVPFMVLRRLAVEYKDETLSILDSPARLKEAVAAVVKKEYGTTQVRVARSTGRLIGYLLLTKTILVFLIELPYDTIVRGSVGWLPLGINITVPPFLLFIFGISAVPPSTENTVRIEQHIEDLIAEKKGDTEKLSIRIVPRTTVASLLFTLVTAGLFVAAIIGIVTLLRRFDFSTLSIVVFLAFLSIVSFLGSRLHHTARALAMTRERSGFIQSVVDALLLPFSYTGRLITTTFAQANLFLVFLDIFIEMPLKVFLSLLQGWVAFIRERKEEL
ncbi:MAG: hypothetical protein HY459_02400 [Parcubacteria group bacterium]|nr:hypothetical protein [Parcubacteria group bacterium]